MVGIKEQIAMKSTLSADHFHSEVAAFEYVEARLWANGRVCPHCGVVDNSGALKGKTTRVGLYKCYACRKPFTVRMGTIFESSHVKLNIWLQAIYLLCSSKKGISTRQLQRTFGGSMKTVWFLGHRIREAMRTGELAPMGGAGGIVEIDETYIGRKAGVEMTRGGHHKNAVLTLVERGGGGFRREVQPRRQHWFLNEKSGFPFRTPAFCSVSRGQRRLAEKEYRAPSVTPGVALRPRTQGPRGIVRVNSILPRDNLLLKIRIHSTISAGINIHDTLV